MRTELMRTEESPAKGTFGPTQNQNLSQGKAFAQLHHNDKSPDKSVSKPAYTVWQNNIQKMLKSFTNSGSLGTSFEKQHFQAVKKQQKTAKISRKLQKTAENSTIPGGRGPPY